MAICRPKAIDDAPSSGRSAAEDGGGETFLPREEWANRGPRALSRGVASPGEESLAAAIAAQAIEAQPSFGQIEPSGPAWFAWVRQLLKENTWRISTAPHKRPCSSGEEKE